jgi:hypothetical protein
MVLLTNEKGGNHAAQLGLFEFCEVFFHVARPIAYQHRQVDRIFGQAVFSFDLNHPGLKAPQLKYIEIRASQQLHKDAQKLMA